MSNVLIAPINFDKIAQVKTIINLCSKYTTPMTMDDIRFFDENPYANIVTAINNDDKQKVIGVAVYEDVNPDFRQLLYIGVHPGYRGKGVGSMLFKHSIHMSKPIKCVIPTKDKDMNNWLRQRGFKAEILWRDFFQFNNSTSDAICMVW